MVKRTQGSRFDTGFKLGLIIYKKEELTLSFSLKLVIVIYLSLEFSKLVTYLPEFT